MKREELLKIVEALPKGTDINFYLLPENENERDHSDENDVSISFAGEISTSGLDGENPFIDFGFIVGDVEFIGDKNNPIYERVGNEIRVIENGICIARSTMLASGLEIKQGMPIGTFGLIKRDCPDFFEIYKIDENKVNGMFV